MANTSLFMLSQVAKHKSKNNCWLVINGRVLNVNRFLEEHLGGDVVILEVAGKDVTKEFQAARQQGRLECCLTTMPETCCSSTMLAPPATTFKETGKQLTAIMVKDDSTQKYVPFLELFVPFLVVR